MQAVELAPLPNRLLCRAVPVWQDPGRFVISLGTLGVPLARLLHNRQPGRGTLPGYEVGLALNALPNVPQGRTCHEKRRAQSGEGLCDHPGWNN